MSIEKNLNAFFLGLSYNEYRKNESYNEKEKKKLL